MLIEVRVDGTVKVIGGNSSESLMTNVSTLSDIVSADDLDSVEKLVRKVSENSGFASIECKLRLDERGYGDFICSAFKTDGMVTIVVQDISRHKRAERALERTQARVRSLLESMPIGVATINAAGIVEAVNPEAERMFKANARQLSGKHAGCLFAPSTERTVDSINSLLVKSLDKKIEIEGRTADGASLPLEISVRRLDNDESGRLLLCMIDTTEREELERLKREFTSMISHDLRTPLTSLQCFLDGLSRGLYDDSLDTIKQRSSNAEVEVTRLIELVRRLLDIDKLESGELEPVKEKFPVERLVSRTVDSLRSLAEQASVKLVTEMSDSFVFADEEQLIQVMINLVGNAIKFSRAGDKVTITVEQNDTGVVFSVKDQGPGIPVEYRSRIFDRFEQVRTNNEREGHGLGLAICKSIVTAHGGTIGVNSEEGKGSRFWFSLPESAGS